MTTTTAAEHSGASTTENHVPDEAVALLMQDTRDRTGSVVRRLDRASAEARRAASRVSETMGGDLNELRRVALHSISGVRQALGDAAGAVRDLGD